MLPPTTVDGTRAAESAQEELWFSMSCFSLRSLMQMASSSRLGVQNYPISHSSTSMNHGNHQRKPKATPTPSYAGIRTLMISDSKDRKVKAEGRRTGRIRTTEAEVNSGNT